MDLFGSLFGTQQPQTGNPLAPAPPQSNFWDGLLSGAVRGVEQSFATSDTGKGLQGFLTQGQSQVAAMNLFGNPLVLIGLVAVIGFIAVKVMAK